MAASRREFLASSAAALALPWTSPTTQEPTPPVKPPPFRISLAEWSLHRALQAGELEHLDFAPLARSSYGIEGAEFVNRFFEGKAKAEAYLKEMKRRADDAGVACLLIMVDGEGPLASADGVERARAIENHRKWLEAATFLGCHSVRVNAYGSGSPEAMRSQAADSLVKLAELAPALNVIVENHGGLSSDGGWMSALMREAGHPRVGTLPDFGNFNLGEGPKYDRYKGVEEMMPFAKALSAKSYDFDEEGNETTIDFERMLAIVLGAGYRSWIGIEYEGKRLSEPDGIRRTKALLERLRGR
ncbi:MAG TPA: sugar phosphate isomerase/epimerase family protein [Planctomycetota bacterium]|nr:sugar phosphate isomerase/epimerase family protein [Planctomycetota bacterium]